MAAAVATAVMTTGLTFAPSLLSAAEGARGAAANTGGRHARLHTTTKAARFISDIRKVQGALNQCRGPVAWNSHGEGAPWLMFEHNYCGGSWTLHTRAGDRLLVRNGPLAGAWRANGRVRLVNQGAMVSTTRGLGELVVQTCVFGSRKMRLVGFDRLR